MKRDVDVAKHVTVLHSYIDEIFKILEDITSQTLCHEVN